MKHLLKWAIGAAFAIAIYAYAPLGTQMEFATLFIGAHVIVGAAAAIEAALAGGGGLAEKAGHAAVAAALAT